MEKLSVIQYVGDNSVLVAKSVEQDFFSKSAIIVNESQEALLYKDGQALDLFPSGRHELNTENLPLFKRIFARFFDRKNGPVSCYIYFINKATVMDMLWGTDSPIDLMDPVYKILIAVRANGQMGVRVVDSRKFVVKLVGQLSDFTISDVKRCIKGVLMACVKRTLATAIATENTSILEIQARLLELSSTIQNLINDMIRQEYGIEVTSFFVNTIDTPQEYLAKLRAVREKRMQAESELDMDVERRRRMAEADAHARAVQGYTYQDERRFDVMQDAARNAGPAGVGMGVGMGVAMGQGLGAGIGRATADAMGAMTATPNYQNAPQSGVGAPAPGTAGKTCPVCGTVCDDNAKFCSGCGSKLPDKPVAKFCQNCGTKLDGVARFCPNCGNKVG